VSGEGKLNLKLAAVIAAVVGMLYLILSSMKKATGPILTTSMTPLQTNQFAPTSFFQTPSPVPTAKNSGDTAPGVTTGPTLAQAGVYAVPGGLVGPPSPVSTQDVTDVPSGVVDPGLYDYRQYYGSEDYANYFA
jgi:hypothetical protein